MTRRSSTPYKLLLAGLVAVLLVGVSLLQGQLNGQRAELGLTRITPLENAPPVLAFTTVALGSFRGLIANALWIRANELQLEGKYFEIVQLADWITKLQPTFDQVWKYQAWNMAYNISVKFSDPADRWRWVRRGIELIRDEGLRYNPNKTLLYHELAWHFQHKMGQNMDDAHLHYKQQWALEMEAALGSSRTNLAELVSATSPGLRARAEHLRTKYKLDPALMKEVDDRYGPLEWRLPEAHAIYWAVAGLKLTSADRQNKNDLRTLRRVVYQCMQQSVLHGRLLSLQPLRLEADLAKVDAANAAYEQMIANEPDIPDSFRVAHRNFLLQVVYLLNVNGQRTDADRWWSALREKYPQFVPANLSAHDYTLQRLTGGELNSLGHDRVRTIISGLIANSYASLAVDDDTRAASLEFWARSVYSSYSTNIARGQQRIALPPFPEMKEEVLQRFLAPESGVDPRVVDRLRTKLGRPAPAANAPPSP
ncbi:MAG TPA: hypothetical protein VNO52_08410 [Methylomirabilota bacterium]|nr:hypothetical protein [Methylomirabilota bacterium]